MKGKALLCLALVTSMLLGVFVISPVSAPSTTMGVEPSSKVDLGLVPGLTFTVSVMIRNVANLAAFEFKLGYDTAVLTVTQIQYGGIFPVYMELGKVIHEAEGWIHYAVMVAPGQPPFSGNGSAAIIHFTVDSLGASALNLYDTMLGAPPDPSDPLTPIPIPHTALDGYFRNVPETYKLTINADPISVVEFTVDDAILHTPWTGYLAAGSHTIVMPSTWGIYDFDHWENNSTIPTRVVDLTSNMNITAYYVKRQWTLNVNSLPIDGFNFILGVVTNSTPWSGLLDEGNYTVVMLSPWKVKTDVYSFDHWEDNTTAPTRVISLTSNVSITAYYEYYSRAPTIGVEPKETIDPLLDTGKNFTVNIMIRDVENLAAFEFCLGYNTSVLTATQIEYRNIFPVYTELGKKINETEGWLSYGVMVAPGQPSFSGDGCAAIIHFTVDSVGDSALDLYQTKLRDSGGLLIEHEALDGYFNNVPVVLVGWIEGTVTDADTALAIEGATVSAIPTGYLDLTDASGFYSIEVPAPAPETYYVIAKMTGYLSQIATVIVVANTIAIQNFTLSPSLTTIGVEPSSKVDTGLGPGSNFTVEIWVRNVTDLQILEFHLRYNTTVLTATSITYGGIFGANKFEWGGTEIWDNLGWLAYGVSPKLGEPSFTGDGCAAIINFTVDSVGDSALDLYETELRAPPRDSVELLIDHKALDGYVSARARLVHDIAITNVVPSPTEVTAGENVTINVTVKNEGNFNETFDVTVYYGNTAIDTETVSLGNGTSTTLTFTWDTKGVTKGTYTIKAEAILDLDDETDDNTREAEDTVTIEAAPAPNILVYAALAAVAIAIITAAAIFIVKLRK